MNFTIRFGRRAISFTTDTREQDERVKQALTEAITAGLLEHDREVAREARSRMALEQMRITANRRTLADMGITVRR